MSTDPRLNLPKRDTEIPEGDYALPASQTAAPAADVALPGAAVVDNSVVPAGVLQAGAQAKAANDFTFTTGRSAPAGDAALNAVKATTQVSVKGASLNLGNKGLTY